MSDLAAKVRFGSRHLLLIAVAACFVLSSSSGRAAIISFSTLFGGSGGDQARDVALDGSGNIFITGIVKSTDFPGLDSATLPNGGRNLIYVASFDVNGRTLRYVTAVGTPAPNPSADPTLGLNGGTRVMAMAVDSAGSVYAAAYEAFGTGGRLIGSRYLYKLDAAGHVQWAFLLDAAVASVRAVAVDASGSAYLAGNAMPGLTTTPGVVYPTTNRTGTFLSSQTPYLLKVDPAGQRALYATYLSQSGQRPYDAPSSHDRPVYDFGTTPYALAVDGSGNVYVTGQATSDFAATPGAADFGSTGHVHTFVAKVSATASTISYVARMGGSNSDRGTSIAVAPDGSAVVGGKALMAGYLHLYVDFPRTLGAFQSDVYCVLPNCVLGDDGDHGYIFKLGPGGGLVFSGVVSSYGGSLAGFYGSPDIEETPVRVAIDRAGNVWGAGTTSLNRFFPTANPILPTPPNSDGAFLMEVDPPGGYLMFATVLPSVSAAGLASDRLGSLILAGYAGSSGFPQVASWQGSLALPAVAGPFVTKISDVAIPVALTVDVNPAVSGAPVHLSATVGAARDLGTVEFLDGGTVLGTSPLAGGVASLNVTLPAGIHPLTAVYHGPGQFNGASSPVIYEVVNLSCD